MKDKKCIGCGITLQDKDEKSLGYINDLSKDYCMRCFKLMHYGEYEKKSMTEEYYKKIISSIPKDSIVLYICDILFMNLETLKDLKNVILVLTKRDTLPKSVKDEKIKNYIKKRYPNVIDIEIVSSINNYNIDNLYNKIISYNKKVYFVGYTNSGKSTLLNKIIKNYSNINTKITTSMYPETTLDKIEIKLDNVVIVDTPGLLNNNSYLNNLEVNRIKRFNIKKEIKPRTFQINNKGSIIIDDMIRIDYNTKSSNSVTIYINNGVKVAKISEKNNILKQDNKISLKLSKDKDIVIDDICFLKFVNNIDIDLYTKDKLNVRVRDNLI